MNHSKLYVPDPNVWINFFKKSSQKKVINQKGGNNVLSAKQSNEPMNVELISPVEAGDERTQSVIKRLRKKATSRGQRLRRRIKRNIKSRLFRKRRVAKSKRHRSVKLQAKRRKRSKSVKTARDIFSKK